MTTGRELEYMRDDILRALDGEVLIGEDENGPVYEKGSLEECRHEVSRIFDLIAYRMNEALSSGRAMDNIAKRHGLQFDLMEFGNEFESEKMRYIGEYTSLSDPDDYLEEGR